jgi:hypothetical protein
MLSTSVVAAGHEGVMAKALAPAYWPGQRSAVWRKIKTKAEMHGGVPEANQPGDDPPRVGGGLSWVSL